jgi:hypothetical protein
LTSTLTVLTFTRSKTGAINTGLTALATVRLKALFT